MTAKHQHIDMDRHSTFQRVMETAGFFVDGAPAEGLVDKTSSSVESRPFERFRYRSLFDKLGAEAVYEVSGFPCVYFRSLASVVDSADLALMQRLAWNHGLAPLLWVITPTQVFMVNCFARPQSEALDSTVILREFETTTQGLRELETFASRYEFESGRFWTRHEAGSVNKKTRVDNSLLNDLVATEQKLRSMDLKAETVHALLGQAVFVSYLQDRQILKKQFFLSRFAVNGFAEVLSDKRSTSDLFEWLESTFNGDLFTLQHHIRLEEVSQEHLAAIQDFLRGTNPLTGQTSFWPYRFDVIPVELISSVYEKFTYSRDWSKAKAESTHYTPLNIVDLILSEIMPKPVPSSKVLDLACGSGVFLVEALRRLVIGQGGEALNRKTIRECLRNQIFGVDINPEAIQITALSLYLTALELDPDPQPPSALKFDPLIGKNLFTADSLDTSDVFNASLKQHHFTAIVGNPPWTWKEARSVSVKEYTASRSLVLARWNPDQAFLHRSGEFANPETKIGLVLHAKPFFSHTEKALEAKRRILNDFNLELLVNLSELRNEYLFPTSVAPAMIFIGSRRRPHPDESFTYVSIEGRRGFKRHGIIEIDADNVKRLKVPEIIKDDDLLKIASLGTARDLHLIRRLRAQYPRLADVILRNRWNAGQGLKLANGTEPVPELKDMPLLIARKLNPFRIDATGFPVVGDALLERKRDPKIYQGPLVIAARGITKGRFIAGYSSASLAYTQSYYGVSIPDEAWAFYIDAVLNSDLAQYYLFLTSSEWGVERDEVKVDDLRRLPLPELKADHSFDLVIRLIRDEIEMHRSTPNEQWGAQLNAAICDCYQLTNTERKLVSDFLDSKLAPRMRWRSAKGKLRPSVNDMNVYVDTFSSVLTPYLMTSGQQSLTAYVYDVPGAPLQVVRFAFGSGRVGTVTTEIVQADEIHQLLEGVAEKLPSRLRPALRSARNMRLYDRDDIYLVKPAEYRFWNSSAALNDGDSVLREQLATA